MDRTNENPPKEMADLVTSAFALEHFARIRAEFDTEQARQTFRQDAEQMYERERLHVQTTANITCPSATAPREFQGRGINAAILLGFLRGQFHNPRLLELVGCITESLLLLSPSAVAWNDRLRAWLRRVERVGAPSVQGVALRASTATVQGLFVIKAATSSQSALVHELFVALFGTNRMRSILPNFAYVFGGFVCSPTIFGANDEVVSWCARQGLPQASAVVQYILYENIEPAVTFGDYVRNQCTGEEFLNAYLQVLYAIRRASGDIGFTHYDLHDANVLIRELVGAVTPPVLIAYETETGAVEYIRARRIATIIDFGMAHIYYRGEDFGYQEGRHYGVWPVGVFPLGDAYRLLLSLAVDAFESNNAAVMAIIAEIHRFFNATDPIDVALDRQQSTGYTLPLTIRTGGRARFDDLLVHIRARCDCPFLVQEVGTQRVLGCEGTGTAPCADAVSLREQIIAPQPATILQLYETLASLQEQNRAAEIPALLERFPRQTAMSAAVGEARELDAALDPVAGLVRVVAANAIVPVLLHPEFVARYRDYLTQVARYRDIFRRLLVQLRAIDAVAQRYKDEQLLAHLRRSEGKVQARLRSLERLEAGISEDFDYIERQLSPDARRMIEAEAQYNAAAAWWLQTFPLFRYLRPQ